MRLLLDTCTFLWMVAEPGRLSDVARAGIVSPENDVFLSAISAWEIGIKHASGRLTLATPPAKLVPSGRDSHGIEPLELTEEAALIAARLPELHRDPFDRALVGQSIAHDLVIVTPDPMIAAYAVRTLW